MTPRLPYRNQTEHALYAGVLTACLWWLSLALFIAPYWAAQTNYPGHHHAPGTVPHTHSAALIPPAFTAWLPTRLGYSHTPRFAPQRTNQSRAPPTKPQQ